MKSGRITLLMTLAVLAGFGVIMLMNVAALVGIIPARYISPNDVRGIAVEHQNKLYTLNFAQQNTLVDIINRSIPVSPEEVQTRKTSRTPEVTKIIIYRFNAPDIEIRPIAFVGKKSSVTSDKEMHSDMVLQAPEWNANGYLEEGMSDELEKLLLTTYDH